MHFDVWGSTENMSIVGSRYFVTFIDDYNRHTWACLIEKKSKVFSCFLKVKSPPKHQIGWKIECLKSNGGKEYFFDQFSSYLQKEGIQCKFSYTYTSEQNGVAERKNQTIDEAAKEMLEEKSMCKFYWAEAVRATINLQNQTSVVGGEVSPHEF